MNGPKDSRALFYAALRRLEADVKTLRKSYLAISDKEHSSLALLNQDLSRMLEDFRDNTKAAVREWRRSRRRPT